VKAVQQSLKLRDDDVFVVAGITDDSTRRRTRTRLVSWQIPGAGVGCRTGQVRTQHKEGGIVHVEIGLVIRSTPVNVVEIEFGRAVVEQGIGIVLLLQAARRIECQVMINELAKVGIGGRDSAFLVIGAVLGIGRISLRCHRFAELVQAERDAVSSAPKSAGGKARKMRPKGPLKRSEPRDSVDPRTPAP
jgi:hypothetical protein